MPKGHFIWYELMTSDTTAAETFYTNVVGWAAKDSGMPGMAYTIFSVGGAGVGGMMTVPEEARKNGARPAWLGYVLVDDADACAAKFARAGGTVHRGPADIPNVGRFAVLSDPQGAMIQVLAPAGGPPGERPPPNTPGLGGWHELQTIDQEAAFAFYADQFGWTKGDAMNMGPMGTYQIFAIDGAQAGGMMNKLPEVTRPFWLYYFNVAGIDAAVSRISDSGGQVLHGPMEVPGGSWIVQATDPQGAMFALVGPKG